jgi:hypothetical protein
MWPSKKHWAGLPVRVIGTWAAITALATVLGGCGAFYATPSERYVAARMPAWTPRDGAGRAQESFAESRGYAQSGARAWSELHAGRPHR